MSDVVLKVEWQGRDVTVSAVDTEGVVRSKLGLRPPASVEVVCAAVAKVAGGAVSAVEVSAPSGLVVLDAKGNMPCPPLLGDEAETAPDAKWLASRLPGGAADWAAAVGSEPAAGWMLAKLSFVHRSRDDVWAAMHRALTPQAWLVHSLCRRAVTDATDAAGIGAWAAEQGYRADLLAIVDKDRDWTDVLPEVVPAGADLAAWQGVPVRASAGPR